MEEVDGQASAEVQETCSILCQEMGTHVEDAFIVDLDSEDTVADGHTSSPKTTSAHTLEHDEKAPVGVLEKVMVVGAIHEAEMGRS